MKVSLIFSLVVQATLSLKQKVFVDSVNLIVHTCDKKTTNKVLFAAEKQTNKKNSKVTSVVNFIPSRY